MLFVVCSKTLNYRFSTYATNSQANFSNKEAVMSSPWWSEASPMFGRLHYRRQCFVSFTCKFGYAYNNTNVIFTDYDYDAEYTLPSNGPPPIQEPPGAYSGRGTTFSCYNGGLFAVLAVYWCFSRWLQCLWWMATLTYLETESEM